MEHPFPTPHREKREALKPTTRIRDIHEILRHDIAVTCAKGDHTAFIPTEEELQDISRKISRVLLDSKQAPSTYTALCDAYPKFSPYFDARLLHLVELAKKEELAMQQKRDAEKEKRAANITGDIRFTCRITDESQLPTKKDIALFQDFFTHIFDAPTEAPKLLPLFYQRYPTYIPWFDKKVAAILSLREKLDADDEDEE
ncbi:MAG: hypothetical protein COU33_03155 [Candidatus Magasanikbacteria bacterium CG10_big_fil_rev_8_21_14_0_10_43_6]|uniref:Uncharacterized protein n=1 Tax=Candidatus Magasanikbacteria bacterium CG10_big_fil_rev_8_21_14_0_10_43_6 TaxID=1974650 RepID=A0A2M6W125_9BACT|nr:MAG: hypothetical protein COU33_03155 [Candidatus Magasanikbacteria bacterium CG10_big_fil_rev_8_21_14_0_10_43_6]